MTVIGLGLMGRALAEAFLRAGHPTTVWNRTAAKADPLVAQGATLAASVGEAVAAAPLVVVCVADYDAVLGLLDPVGEVLDGRVLVNLTSGSSAQARQTARWADERSVGYLDGAIMTDPQAVGGADTVILYSGSGESFARHAPTLRVLGGKTTHLGEDHGLASLHDVALLSLMWSVLNSFLHGAALVGTAGVGAAALHPLAVSIIETTTGWLSRYARQVDDGAYPADDATIDTHRGAMAHLVHESAALGIDVDLPRFLTALADRAVADGRGGEGYSAMIEQFRRPSATQAASAAEAQPTDVEQAPDASATPFDPHTLLAEARLGVLATIRSDGRPQLSPVTPFYDRAAGVLYVSMTEGRAKTVNLRRDPRATLEVTSADGWAWATAEGTATLIGPGTDPHGPEVEALVDYYRSAAGEHPDWDEYRSVMVSDRRVLMVMTVDHVYGADIG
ncbi:PPOX class putative F420-dependent enzyme [Actinoalloteichus sp. GBA129-24]|nr:PPOX class putative F420-dependent enzyme [Actinoalloteichus sp. GBA129-24]